MTADFYACDMLTHESAEEAIEAYLDEMDPKDWPSEVTAEAFVKKVISESDKRSAIIRGIEAMVEYIDDEYGNPDELYKTKLSTEGARLFFDQVFCDFRVWQCEHVSKEDVTVYVSGWVRNNTDWWRDGADFPDKVSSVREALKRLDETREHITGGA